MGTVEAGNSDKWRILFVNAEGRIAGAENSLLLLITCLQKRHSVSVACPAGGPLAEKVRQIGCQYHYLSPRRKGRGLSVFGLARLLSVSWRISRIVSAIRPDVIHANSVYAAVGCLFSAYRTKARLVWHARDIVRFRFISRLCGWPSSCIIAISQFVARRLINQGVSPSKIRVIFNGIEPATATLSKNPETSSVNDSAMGERPIVFANVGQFVPWKKQTLFLAAADQIRSKIPKARFWLVGDDVFQRDGKYKRSLEDYVAAKGLSDVVSFTGWQQNMDDVWRNVGCLVHAADTEPFGRVIIEAMASGVPVIATDSGGPGEIIEDGVTGILVRPNDVESLGRAMLRIASDSGLARRLSTAAYKAVMARYTPEQTAMCVEQVYGDILSAGQYERVSGT